MPHEKNIDRINSLKTVRERRFNTEILDFLVVNNPLKLKATDFDVGGIRTSQRVYWLRKLRELKDQNRPFLKNYHYDGEIHPQTNQMYYWYWYEEK